MMIDWELIGCGVLIMFMIFIGRKLMLKWALTYIKESSKEIKANIQKVRDETIAKIEKSGKETRGEIQRSGEDARASMRDLSQMITRSPLATKEELIEMLGTLE